MVSGTVIGRLTDGQLWHYGKTKVMVSGAAMGKLSDGQWYRYWKTN